MKQNLDSILAIKVVNAPTEYGGVSMEKFYIYVPQGIILQCFGENIAFIDNAGQIVLDINNWNKSRVVSDYRKRFLREGKRDTDKKIASGEYLLLDLNKFSPCV